MDLIFYGQFVTSGLGATGLTVTVDVDQIERATGTRTALTTGGSGVVEGRRGWYEYRLTSANLHLYDYMVTFITANTADLKHVPALWTNYAMALAGSVPTATAGALNGLATVDGSNRIAGIQGTKHTLDDLNDLASGAVQSASNAALVALGMTLGRMGYLDNLNVSGLVASSAEVTAIQNNTRVVRVIPTVLERPDSGSVVYRFELFCYDSTGNMEAPDSAPTVGVVNQSGTSRNAALDSTTMTVVSTGRYRGTYTVTSADALEQLLFTFAVTEGGQVRSYGNSTLLVDTTAVDFTSSDRTVLQNLADRASEGRLAELDAGNLPADLDTLLSRISGAVLLAEDYEAAPSAADNAAAFLDAPNAIETGLTPRGALRLAVAALAGILAGAATTEITLRSAVSGSKTRITATVDASGNRTSLTYDLT